MEGIDRRIYDADDYIPWTGCKLSIFMLMFDLGYGDTHTHNKLKAQLYDFRFLRRLFAIFPVKPRLIFPTKPSSPLSFQQ